MSAHINSQSGNLHVEKPQESSHFNDLVKYIVMNDKTRSSNIRIRRKYIK